MQKKDRGENGKDGLVRRQAPAGKGLDLVEELIYETAKNNKDRISFFIVGEGPMRKGLEERIDQRNLNSNGEICRLGKKLRPCLLLQCSRCPDAAIKLQRGIWASLR